MNKKWKSLFSRLTEKNLILLIGFDIIVDDIEHWRVAISTIISNTRYTLFYTLDQSVL